MRFWIFAIFAFGCTPPTEVSEVEPSSVNVQERFENPDLPPPTDTRYSASHILISWRGAAAAHDDVTRSEKEALIQSQKLLRRLQDGANFSALAASYSDDASGQRGGVLGVFQVGTMVPIFEAAVASTPIGQIGPLVRTPFGYHVLRRDKIVEARASHILISHSTAPLSTHNRTKDAAKTLAWEAYKKIDQGRPFDEVAKEYSDDVTASQNGGDLGLIGPSQMVPAFDEVLFSLKPGQLSEPFETPYGYHVVARSR